MALTGVRCTVDSCHFWGQNNTCHASEILVTSDGIARKYPNSQDVQQLSAIVESEGETPVDGCVETCCKTFEPKH